MTYITNYNWVNDEKIIFELNTGKVFNYRCKKYNCENKYFLANKEGRNNKLLIELGISDPYEWAENILGYRLCDAGWPEAKSVEDLKKVIDALLKYNNPKLSVFWWKPSNSVEESFIFDSLKIKEKNKWVKNIQGYEPSGGTDKISFPESKTKGDAIKVMDALIAEYIKQFQPKTTIKTNSYGDSKIELRRKKADVRVGSCPAGSIVYGKRSKASVRSRRVSYQTCIGN